MVARALPSAETLAAFRGRRVFITGHTGFKGSWLALWLTELGAEVTGYALPPDYDGSHFERLGLTSRLHHIEADIRDLARLQSAMRDAQPEYVFHLAAQALVRKSYADPVTTFATNVLGSMHVLEAVRQTDCVKSLVYVTSDKCYFNKEWTWSYRETDELGGLDPYSASKAAAENVFLAYNHSFLARRDDLGAATARAGNVIGGGDWSADRLVPDCITALMRDEPIVLRSPNATRPWQLVLEPLGGYLILALKLRAKPQAARGSWNFGPDTGDARTVDQVARQIVRHWGSGAVQHNVDPRNEQHEATLLQLNIEKAAHLLGWRPVYSVEKSVAETVAWYKGARNEPNVAGLSRKQIADYMNAAAELDVNP